MKQLFILAITASLFLSCKDNKETTTQEKSVEIEKIQNEAEKSDKLQLTNNEKWNVNQEMKPYVLQGEKLVKNYIETNQTDYVQLGKQLEDQNNQLIKSCTMEGASHDELHKWLHPHLELVGNLKNTADTKKGQMIVQDLALSYETYHQYFN